MTAPLLGEVGIPAHPGGRSVGPRPPRFAQREHHPPVEPAWPFLPPKHQLWIEPKEDTAVLMIVLFGQVWGAVPVNDLPTEAEVSA
jgi:hypothetical protein